MAVIGAIGLVTAGLLAGRAGLAGFFLGSLYSAFSFRFFHRVVEAMGTESPRKVSALFLTFRLLLLGGLLYVILKYLETSLPAALWGLFLGIAAVILESLYELFYART